MIDPVKRRLTHLVVVPRERAEDARLAPIEGAHGPGGPAGISLERTIAELNQADPIHESAVVPRGKLSEERLDWDAGIQEMYETADPGGVGPAILGGGMAMEYDQNVAISYHRIPKGEIEIRRASQVISSDDRDVGHVIGFVIDDSQIITQLVLEHGHLWGKRMVVIPGAATTITWCEGSRRDRRTRPSPDAPGQRRQRRPSGHRQQAAYPVVGIVRRREPRIVDPRPANRERGEQKPDNRRTNVTRREVVRELIGRSPECNRERQVVQALQRRRDPPCLMRVTARHRASTMRALLRPCPHGRNVLESGVQIRFGRRELGHPAWRSDR